MRRRLFWRRARDAAPPDPPCVGCVETGVATFALHASADHHVDLDDLVVRTPGHHDVVVEGELVVYEPATGRTHRLNTSAALVLTSAAAPTTVRALVDDLVADLGIDRHALERDVPATVSALLRAGLLATGDQQGSRDSDASSGARTDDDLGFFVRRRPGPRWDERVGELLGGLDWGTDLGPRLFAHAAVRVRTDDDAVGDALETALTALPDAPPDRPAAVVSIRGHRRDPRRHAFQIYLDHDRVAGALDAVTAVGRSLILLNHVAAIGSGGHLLLHAGAVEQDGQVVVVAGRSGWGKTTLVAGLVRRGWSYLTDELVAIDPHERGVVPYPKALHLDADAVDRLGLDPTTLGDGTYGFHVPPAALGRVSRGGTLAALVLLDDPRSPDEAGERGTAADVLIDLLANCFPQTWREPGALGALGAVAETVPALRLPRMALPAALDRVEAFGGRPPAHP
jgi:hypothetical protein